MLRDYQIDICTRVSDAFDKHRSVMVQMPTGTGKTVVLASLVIKILKDERIKGRSGRILIVAHRRELIEQIKATIKRMGLNANNHSSLIDNQPIIVESIQTISRRLTSNGVATPHTGGQGGFSLVVIDEAHHALAKTYKMMWDAWPDAKFLGLTATPCRLNGKGFTDLFDVLLSSLTVPEFIRKGVLAPFDYVTINEGSSQQQLIDSLTKRGADGDYQVKEMNEVLNKRPSIEQLYKCYTKFAKKKKGIVYAVSIEHARSIAEYYESKGIKAVAISAKTPAKEREKLIDAFKRVSSNLSTISSIQVLVNVDIFSEGFDCPDVEFIQLARPTLSLAKYLQMVGRGLRPHKKKECCVILDNVGLVRLFGLPTRCWNWQSAFEGRMKVKDELLRIRDNQSSAINNQPIEDFSLVIAHEQLEQLIKDAKLEEWNSRQGILEEEAKAFQSENGKLWGLRRGGMIMVEPTYLRVFNIKDGHAAVRLQDTKLAVVDMSGNMVRGLGKGRSAHLCSKDFVEVERNNDYDYIDLLSGKPYYHLPTLVTRGEIQLIKVAIDGWLLRMKDPFDYGSVNFDYCSRAINEYEYFYMLHLLNDRGNMDSYAVDTRMLIVFKGDNERAYWLYDVHEDSSLDVIDRQGNAYHVMPDGTREKLNRCDILEQSMSILKEIAIQYRKKGGAPDDQYNLRRFRNRVLADRLSEKLKALKIKNHL